MCPLSQILLSVYKHWICIHFCTSIHLYIHTLTKLCTDNVTVCTSLVLSYQNSSCVHRTNCHAGSAWEVTAQHILILRKYKPASEPCLLITWQIMIENIITSSRPSTLITPALLFWCLLETPRGYTRKGKMIIKGVSKNSSAGGLLGRAYQMWMSKFKCSHTQIYNLSGT